MGKDPGSCRHKGLEASQDLRAEQGTLPLLAGTQARPLWGLPGLILWLKGHKTQSERVLILSSQLSSRTLASPILQTPGSYLEELAEAQ